MLLLYTVFFYLSRVFEKIFLGFQLSCLKGFFLYFYLKRIVPRRGWIAGVAWPLPCETILNTEELYHGNSQNSSLFFFCIRAYMLEMRSKGCELQNFIRKDFNKYRRVLYLGSSFLLLCNSKDDIPLNDAFKWAFYIFSGQYAGDEKKRQNASGKA